MFQRWFRRQPAPLTGAPTVRRQKTYSAQSGYVYQYFYQGHRDAQRGEAAAEYVFDVSADRKNSIPVSVVIERHAVEEWQSRHGRELGANEQYAVAELALFQAFDERENPALMKQEVRVRAADAEAFLSTLDID
jgi:hypothetical protein